jgi:hypothetical protein
MILYIQKDICRRRGEMEKKKGLIEEMESISNLYRVFSNYNRAFLLKQNKEEVP